DEREIEGERQNLRAVKPAGVPEAHWAAQHRGTRQMHVAGQQNDGLVERPAPITVILSDEYPQQGRVFQNAHDGLPFAAPPARQTKKPPPPVDAAGAVSPVVVPGISIPIPLLPSTVGQSRPPVNAAIAYHSIAARPLFGRQPWNHTVICHRLHLITPGCLPL